MTVEDRLRELLHADADAHHPGDGREGISRRVRARRRARIARRVGIPVVAAAIVAAIAVPQLISGTSRTQKVTTVGPSTTTGAGTTVPGPKSQQGTSTLFSVVRSLSFGSLGPNPSLVGIDPTSLFLTGAFTNATGHRVTLVRVDRRRFTIAASADLPDITSAAYGNGSLWWATGRPNIESGCNCTPPPASQLLLRVDPTTLAVLARFRMPAPPLLVTVAGTNLWVATPNNLLRVDPITGKVLTSLSLGFYPVALAASTDNTRVYALGGTSADHLMLSDYDSSTGQLLNRRQIPRVSDGPLAVSPDGVWVPEQDTTTQSTTVQLFQGTQQQPSSTINGLAFDTQPYTDNNTLWLIDGAGEARTICADPQTATERASGGPIGVELSAMASDSQGSYLVQIVGTHDRLLQIQPSQRCS